MLLINTIGKKACKIKCWLEVNMRLACCMLLLFIGLVNIMQTVEAHTSTESRIILKSSPL